MPKVTVALGNTKTVVGYLWFDNDQKRQYSRFEYDECWLTNPDRFRISPDLPLNLGSNFKSANLSSSAGQKSPLHNCFQDASPDSWGRRLLRRHTGKKFLTEFDYLIRTNDYTRQGALRFLSQSGEPLSEGYPEIPRLLNLSQLGKRIHQFENNTESDEILVSELIGSSGSLGGARPKANIDVNGELWIAKFTSTFDEKPVERAEIATQNLAKQCGLNTPESKLMLANTRYPVALIKRFDRQGSNRIPYMSAKTALDPIHEESFYTIIAELIREISDQFQEDLRELWLRLMFTILVSNTDDHLRNHGFVYAGNGRWRLSPVFDVNPSPDRHKQMKTGIAEGHPFEPSVNLAIDNAYYFDIEEHEAKQLAFSMAHTITDNWKKLFRSAGASNSQIRLYESAFEHAEMKKALNLL